MRCKNCGSENNDNLYICQNCGSPLYDENDNIETPDGSTRMFTPPVNPSGYDNYEDPRGSSEEYHRQRAAERERQKKEEAAKKKQVAIIIILVILLIAIIAGIVIAIAKNKTEGGETSLPTEFSSEITEEGDTTSPFTKETSTESTTESTTTTTTTTTTTKAKTYKVTVGTNDSGNADGGGTYKKGETATVWCSADDGTEFIGWYKNGSKVSSSTKYSFKVTGDAYLEARFKKKTTPTKKQSDDSDKKDSDKKDDDSGKDGGTDSDTDEEVI